MEIEDPPFEIYPTLIARADTGVRVNWSWQRRFDRSPIIRGPVFPDLAACIAAVRTTYGERRKPPIAIALNL